MLAGAGTNAVWLWHARSCTSSGITGTDAVVNTNIRTMRRHVAWNDPLGVAPMDQ